MFFIILLAATLRFYRLSEMVAFDFDQEWAANFAYRVVHEFPIQLIGQPLSVEGLFMGPLGFYLLTPFFILTDLHPIGGAIASAIRGIMTIIIYYLVTSRLINVRAGLIAASLRSFSFVELQNDWTIAPLYLSEPLVLLLWYCLHQYWQKKLQYLVPIMFIFGLFTSMHPVMFPFYAVFGLLLLLKRRLPNIKTLAFSLVALILPLLPLIIFEFLHNFLEIKRLIELFVHPDGSSRQLYILISWINFNLREFGRILRIDLIQPELIGMIFLSLFLLLSYKKVQFFRDRSQLILYLLTFAAFNIYYGLLLPKGITEYYFLALTTLAFLYLSAILSYYLAHPVFKTVVIVILLNFLFQSWQSLNNRWQLPLTTLYHKDRIVQEIVKRQPKGSDFYVSYISQIGWNFGFNYLFKLYGSVPQKIEARPPVYTIVLPASLSGTDADFQSGNIRLISPEERE